MVTSQTMMALVESRYMVINSTMKTLHWGIQLLVSYDQFWLFYGSMKQIFCFIVRNFLKSPFLPESDKMRSNQFIFCKCFRRLLFQPVDCVNVGRVTSLSTTIRKHCLYTFIYYVRHCIDVSLWRAHSCAIMWEAERHGPEFQVGQVFAKMLRIV